jgi:hypothetical protein
MCAFLLQNEGMEEWVVIALLKGLFNIFVVVGDELQQLDSLLLSRRINLSAVVNQLVVLTHHQNEDIGHISSTILKRIHFAEVNVSIFSSN